MSRKACGVAVLSVLWLAAAAEAGLTFRQVVRNEGPPRADAADMDSRVWVEGDAMKIEFERAGANPMLHQGSYLLIRGAEAYLVNPKKEEYARMDLAALADMMASAQQMMQQAGMEMRFESPSFEKLLEEDGPEIAGYPTRHYRYRTAYRMTMQMPIGGSMTSDTDTLEDVWTTTAIEVTFDARALESFAGAAFAGEVRELAEIERSKMTGFPLKRVMVSTSTSSGTGMMGRMMSRGDQGPTTTTIEALEIREEAVPASVFELPAGYREVELLPQGAAVPQP